MTLVPVSCQNCGASLEVGESTRYVTCQFCQTQLAVQNTGTAIFTELARDLTAKTQLMADELEELRIRNQILQLEQEWLVERDGLMLRTKRGRAVEPTFVSAWLTGLLLLVVAFFFGLVIHSPRDRGNSTAGLWVLPTFMGIWVIISGSLKASTFEKAVAAYRRRRRELESQLKSGEGSSKH
jgi:hypothetical protein